jgi:hypothetical protein
VEDGDPDLPLELLRVVSEVLLERPAVDRDLGRQVRHLLEEPEDVGLVQVLLLDDHRDILQPGGEVRRERVQGHPDVRFEVHP